MTEDAANTSQAPVFIVGNDRSGTTMLRLILDRSPALSMPTESMIVEDFAPVRKQSGSLADHAAATQFLSTVWNHPKVAHWGLPEQPPEMPRGLSHIDAYRFALSAPYKAYAHVHGKTGWGDKTPSYINLIDEIMAVWPNAQIVNIVRDGRDVSLSLRSMPFGGNNTWAMARDWARGIELGEAAALAYPGQVHRIRYEDLVSNPGPAIEQLCAAIGLEYEQQMLDIHETPEHKVVSGQEDWFEQVWNGINQGSVGKWRRKMDQRQLVLFESIAGEQLDLLGYERATQDPSPASSAATAGYRVQNVAMRGVHFVQLRLISERGRELRYVVKRKLQRR